VPVCGVNVSGDDQADREVHGGEHKAVYAYAWEDTLWWQQELGRDLEPGNFGENLTLSGVDVPAAVVGERWRVGSALLEVSEPRFPCFKFGLRMGDPRFVKRFAAARRTGTYLRIVEEGDVGAGDRIERVTRPDHGVTIGLFAEAYLGDHAHAERLLEAPLAPRWRKWAEQRTAPQSRRQ
jgi:MOSC domain-containing protein YiiM